MVFLSEYLEGSMESWSMSDLSPEKISNVEADCYWCLSKLLDGMQDHYTFAQPGIQRLVFKLKELVRRIDGNFCSPGFFVLCVKALFIKFFALWEVIIICFSFIYLCSTVMTCDLQISGVYFEVACG